MTLPIAQRIEHEPSKLVAAGSNPARRTIDETLRELGPAVATVISDTAGRSIEATYQRLVRLEGHQLARVIVVHGKKQGCSRIIRKDWVWIGK